MEITARRTIRGALQLTLLLGASFLSLATSQSVECDDRESLDQRFVASTQCSNGEQRTGEIRLFGEFGQCDVTPLSEAEREALWLPSSGRMESMSGTLELFGNVDYGSGPEYVHCRALWTVGQTPEPLACRSTDSDLTCSVTLE